MGTKINDMVGMADFLATANIRENVGDSITGVLGACRTLKSGYEKPYVIYTLAVQDANCKFVKNKKAYEPVAGENIELFAPTRLQRQLVQVQPGQTVSIKYLGTTKNKSGKGLPGHTFEVEVI